jgi:acetoin:2,6-dichlorophenolindophenol oxidoreductase subunit beta
VARRITFQQAINEALAQEMERDPTVVIFGEDVAGGAGADGEDDAWGGVLGVTKGLHPRFPDRVLDTPISESAYIGAAAGAAASGLRPVAELMFVDFWACAWTRSSTRRRSSATCSAARRSPRW